MGAIHVFPLLVVKWSLLVCVNLCHSLAHGFTKLVIKSCLVIQSTDKRIHGKHPKKNREWYIFWLQSGAGDLLLLDTTKELIHGALSSPHAGKGLANGEALDQQADDEFSSEVSAAIVDWIAKRMSDYHKNFHDTQLMQVLHRTLIAVLMGPAAVLQCMLNIRCRWQEQHSSLKNELKASAGFQFMAFCQVVVLFGVLPLQPVCGLQHDSVLFCCTYSVCGLLRHAGPV